jgi:hypothetical protein
MDTQYVTGVLPFHHQVLPPHPGPFLYSTLVQAFFYYLFSIEPRQLNHAYAYFELGGHIGVPCLELGTPQNRRSI